MPIYQCIRGEMLPSWSPAALTAALALCWIEQVFQAALALHCHASGGLCLVRSDRLSQIIVPVPRKEARTGIAGGCQAVTSEAFSLGRGSTKCSDLPGAVCDWVSPGGETRRLPSHAQHPAVGLASRLAAVARIRTDPRWDRHHSPSRQQRPGRGALHKAPSAQWLFESPTV